MPDDRFGEVVCAWIRLKYGVQLTEDEIRQYCKGKVNLTFFILVLY